MTQQNKSARQKKERRNLASSPGVQRKKKEEEEKEERHGLGLVAGIQSEQALARLVKGREEPPSRRKRGGQRSHAGLERADMGLFSPVRLTCLGVSLPSCLALGGL